MTYLASASAVRAGSAAARINPVAKLGASLIVSVTLLLSIDAVSASVALVLVLCLVPFSGLDARSFWLRTAPVWIAAPFAAVPTVLYGEDSGALLWDAGVLTVTEGSVSLALAIGLRVLAIGIPGVVLMATTDPTDLADGLSQILRLPARFVLGALAGMRLMGLFVDDWRSLAAARRARGIGDQALVRRLLAQSFGLLVLAIRRGTKLATAMEAKGFGADIRRTWARPSRLGMPDAALVGIAVVVAAAAVAASVLAGTWNPVLS